MVTNSIYPVEMQIVKPVPCTGLLDLLLQDGLVSLGGFPLWLIGGAPSFSDIDLYPLSSDQFNTALSRLDKFALKASDTINTVGYTFDGVLIQLVKPCNKWQSVNDLVYTTDMSPSACVLVWDHNHDQMQAKALYPQDIAQRRCRVLIRHDWTPYRERVYRDKGYVIVYDVWDDQTA